MSLRVISAEHAASTRKLMPVAGSITIVVPSDSDNEVPKSGTWLGFGFGFGFGLGFGLGLGLGLG